MKVSDRGWMLAVSAAVALAMMTAVSGVRAGTEIPTVFTYQGRLSDSGSSATGTFDFIFDLYPDMSGGTAGHTMATNNVPVNDGYFEVYLDYGQNVFTGTFWAVEIRVRPSGAGAYETITPRQPILPTPYAMCAATVEGDGVSAAALQDDAVLSRTIKDGEVSMADMAADSISSNQIVNGTITAADVRGGLYSQKSQLYIRETTNTLGGETGNWTTIDVYCDDEHDLPLSWYAKGLDFAANVMSAEALNWNDPTKRAGMRVKIAKLLPTDTDAVVGIICIRVD